MLQALRHGTRVRVSTVRQLASKTQDLPVKQHTDAKKRDVESLIHDIEPKVPVHVSTEESVVIGGIPEEHLNRTVRIFKQAREAQQYSWNNTKVWRVELDNRERWENPCIGWTSSGDPLSTTSMMLKFATKEEAIAFCEKNSWSWELEKEQEHHILPKQYGSIYAWNKRSRVSTK